MDSQPLLARRGAEKSESVAALKKIWKGSEMPKRVPAIAFVFACALFSLPAVFSQSQAPTTTTTEDAKLRERAMKLHREAIVIDTHNDITSPMTDEGFDMGARDTSGKTQTDIPRMKEGGLDAEFFAIYVAAKYAKEGGAARRALDMIDAKIGATAN